MVSRKLNPEVPACEFTVDADGLPVVSCPTPEAQALAFQVLQRHPDVVIRVNPSFNPESESEEDELDMSLAEADFDGDEEEEVDEG